jgi:hypothetical protein
MTNTSTRIARRPWPTFARTAASILAAVGLVVSAAACAGSAGGHVAQLGSTSATGATSLLAFAHCMRSHGVPSFADPSSSGQLSKQSPQQLGVSSSRFQSAQGACRHLLPTESAAQQQRLAANAVRFSRCMRSHGVTNFPDPAGNGGRIPDPASVGIDQGSPRFQTANQACRTWRPPYIPSNAAYDAWAATSAS